MFVTAFLFLSYDASPFQAYYALFHEPFGTLRGFGYSLVRTSPLALIALGTIVSWRSGFSYLGFEGCFVIGASATAWLALLTAPGARIGPFRFFFSCRSQFYSVLLRRHLGGTRRPCPRALRRKRSVNFADVELRRDFHPAISGLRPDESARKPSGNKAPAALHVAALHYSRNAGARGHFDRVIAAGLVWMLLQKMPLGYELIVTGFNTSAARYAGIDVGRRILLAAFFAGGLGGLAGLVEVLGSQHRVMDGISGGVGFVGIIVALLARLNPVAVIPTALLYGGMSVGADAMQRRVSIPSSITFILQSLAVLLVLAFDALRYYKINLSAFSRRPPPPSPKRCPNDRRAVSLRGFRGHVADGQFASRGPRAARGARRNVRRTKRRAEHRHRGNDSFGSADQLSRFLLHGNDLAQPLRCVLSESRRIFFWLGCM